MNIIEILKLKEKVFIDEDVEIKKDKALIEKVNASMGKMADGIADFEQYKASQLNGEAHNLIVMSKSLANAYHDWQEVQEASKAVAEEEGKKIAQYNALKADLIANLNALLEASKKKPVECAYDMREGDYRKCREGHEVVIFNGHNTGIIEYMIQAFETSLNVVGHFNEIGGLSLDANYGTVIKNLDMCKAAIETLNLKPTKVEKIKKTLSDMFSIGEKVVFFYTYKNSLKTIGVSDKDLDVKEKALAKLYVPIKKYLQKELKVNFADICEVDVDEDSFPPYK